MNESGYSLYNASHYITCHQKNGFVEERNLTINIFDDVEKLQIKLRDMSEYSFNYSESIDLGDFEVIRLNQSLDINFDEFKTNIVEMLLQFQKKEMYLKCQMSDKKCTLVFYTKSKIKSIVYLTLDLHITDQKEIISEMVSEMQEIQDTNKRLQKQLSKARKLVQEKEIEVQDLQTVKLNQLNQFLKNLNQIEQIFTTKFSHFENQVLNIVGTFKHRLFALTKKVEVLKQENNLKVDSSERLLKTMECLRLETIENTSIIQDLKRENSSLHCLRANLEKTIAELKRNLEDVQSKNMDLERMKNEFEKDLEKLSIAITSKDEKVSEISKDLVQANNMLVRFNNYYDDKSQQVEELQNALSVKEKQIMEQKVNLNEVLRSFEEYKTNFNNEKIDSLKKDVFVSKKRVGELEEEIRKTNKINALLTQKVNEGYFKMK